MQQGDAASTSRTPLGSLGCALAPAACWGSNTEWVAPLRCCAGRTVCRGHVTHGDPAHPAMGGVKGWTTGQRAELQDQPQSQGSPEPLGLCVLGETVPHPTRASKSCCPKHGHKGSSWGTKSCPAWRVSPSLQGHTKTQALSLSSLCGSKPGAASTEQRQRGRGTERQRGPTGDVPPAPPVAQHRVVCGMLREGREGRKAQSHPCPVRLGSCKLRVMATNKKKKHHEMWEQLWLPGR